MSALDQVLTQVARLWDTGITPSVVVVAKDVYTKALAELDPRARLRSPEDPDEHFLIAGHIRVKPG